MKSTLDYTNITPKCNPCLEIKSSWISKLFFIWTNPLINTGNKKILKEEDLYEVRPDEKFKWSQDKFQESLTLLQKTIKSPTLIKVLWLMVRKDAYYALTFAVIGNLLQFAGPLLLGQIVSYLSDNSAATWKGYVYASALLVSYVIRAIFMQHGFHKINALAFKTLNSIEGLILRKTLALKSSSRKYADPGKIINFATVDAFGIFGFLNFGMFMFTAPLLIVIALILICLQVGIVGLIGPGIIVIGSIIQGKLQAKSLGVRKENLVYNDQRSKALNEYISGIRIIKYYGWENVVQKKISDIRHLETKAIFKGSILRAITELVATWVPIFISIAVFGLYIAQGNELTPAKAYTVLSLFNLLQIPLRLLAMVLVSLVSANVSIKRIQHFSEWEEYDMTEAKYYESIPNGSLMIKNGEFTWETQQSKIHFEKGKSLIAKVPAGGAKSKTAGGAGSNTTSGTGTKAAGGNSNGDKAKGANGNSAKVANSKGGSGDLERGTKEETSNLTEQSHIPVILTNINIEIKPGELVSVVGQVGSGKSSLLQAFLGEMNKINGEVGLNGKLAYVSQQAWLKSASLRENILFGLAYDKERYDHVIGICELLSDIAILPGGDLTEIGERGINLSGGQKQRVSIARAVYSEADIYLIDDCLSALDAHVGKSVFENVFKKQLKGKTIVFVTHALHYAQECDRIIVMKNGTIIEVDTPKGLIAKADSEFNKLSIKSTEEKKEKGNENENEKIEVTTAAAPLEQNKEKDEKALIPKGENSLTITPEKASNQVSKDDKESAEKPLLATKPKETDDQKAKKGGLLSTEVKAEGAIPWKVYKDYFTAGGCFITSLVCFLFLGTQGLRMVNDWWLGIWSQNQYGLDPGYYILYFFFISFATGLFVMVRGIAFGYFTMRTARILQFKLLNSVLRSPISWFDTTPTGRILNRANKDQDDVDLNLPWTLQMCIQNILQIIATCIMIGIITPLFFIFAFIGTILYSLAIKYYMAASRELKRIESTAKSPTISLIAEAASGVTVIRAFNQESTYLRIFEQHMDNLNRASINVNSAGRWISMRTEFLGACIIGSAAYFGVLSKTFNYNSNAALIGLSLSWALTITTILSFTIKIFADTELQMNSVQRILEYTDKKDHEAPFDTPIAPNNWPIEGNYDAKNVTYRYREGLPNVLHGITFSIVNKEKIGVVGRTGSGKSTLTLGLLRILELNLQSGQEGFIKLNSVDISKLGLHELRKKVTIIPQDPTLFTGTIRSNIDPFSEYTDEAIIEALKKVHIWEGIKGDGFTKAKQEPNAINTIATTGTAIAATGGSGGANNNNEGIVSRVNIDIELEVKDEKKKLDMKIDEGGSNFSLGQRQLICMARALIRKTKVLLMDEATASIDELTDHLIQRMIKTEFKDTTVITIAHRLNTIIKYDRIIVLDQGNIVEFDTPLNLLNKGDSYFAKLIKGNGQEFEKKMRYLAENKDEIDDI